MERTRLAASLVALLLLAGLSVLLLPRQFHVFVVQNGELQGVDVPKLVEKAERVALALRRGKR